MHVVSERGEQIVEPQRAAVARGDEPEVSRRVEATEAEVRLKRVVVGGKIEGVAEDDAACRMRRLEQRGEKLVEIRRGLAGDADFPGCSAEQRGEFFGR